MAEIYDIFKHIIKPRLIYLEDETRKRERVYESGLDTRFERATKSRKKEASGEEIHLRLKKCFFTAYDIVWSNPQQRCAEAAFIASLPKQFGPSWDAEGERFLKKYNIKSFKTETLINMPRRNGKSFAVAGIGLSALLTVPGITVAIFAIFTTQSKQMISDIKKLYDRACAHGEFITSSDFTIGENSVKVFELINNETGMRQRVTAYPGSSKVNFNSFPPSKTK